MYIKCMTTAPHPLTRNPPRSQHESYLNFRIAIDQARSEAPSIVTMAVTRCTDENANHKALAPTIVPGIPQTATSTNPPNPSQRHEVITLHQTYSHSLPTLPRDHTRHVLYYHTPTHHD